MESVQTGYSRNPSQGLGHLRSRAVTSCLRKPPASHPEAVFNNDDNSNMIIIIIIIIIGRRRRRRRRRSHTYQTKRAFVFDLDFTFELISIPVHYSATFS